MAEYLAGALTSGGRILELSGLYSSSPAIERQQGFDSVVATRPGLEIVAQAHADWTEEGAFRVMDSLLSKSHPQFDCLFAHNDRMAMGARRAAAKHGLDINSIQFCGIDAMPQNGGGMRLVTDGTLFASYIYPTRGDEVIQLAMNILTKKDYKRENQLSSALVTRDNARVLLMQNDETVRQARPSHHPALAYRPGCQRIQHATHLSACAARVCGATHCGVRLCHTCLRCQGAHQPTAARLYEQAEGYDRGDGAHDSDPVAVLHQR